MIRFEGCACEILDTNPPSRIDNPDCRFHGEPPRLSFYSLKTSRWSRYKVYIKVGSHARVIARFWSWDRADKLVDEMAQLTMPIWVAEVERANNR